MDAVAQLKALISEEPALEIEFPRVFVQPKIESYCRGKSNTSQLLRSTKKSHISGNGEAFTRAYNELVVEFRPFLNWAFSCWDYLLTTEGIRYLSRPEGEKLYCHGDYRAFTDKDFYRFTYRIFKECALSCDPRPKEADFVFYLKKNYWQKIVEEYKKLENPPDPRQRKLTLYSYLRCVPYEFLNNHHQEVVNNTLGMLEKEEREIIEAYFLNFFKEEEILQTKNIAAEDFSRLKEEGLNKLALLNPLVYALLLQIERY